MGLFRKDNFHLLHGPGLAERLVGLTYLHYLKLDEFLER